MGLISQTLQQRGRTDLEVDAAAESADSDVDDGDDADRHVHADRERGVNRLEAEELVTARVLVDDDQAQQRQTAADERHQPRQGHVRHHLHVEHTAAVTRRLATT